MLFSRHAGRKLSSEKAWMALQAALWLSASCAVVLLCIGAAVTVAMAMQQQMMGVYDRQLCCTWLHATPHMHANMANASSHAEV